MSETAEIRALLDGDTPVAREDVRQWIASNDLATWSIVYELTGRGWSRITPELEGDEQIEFMTAYLLRCIEESPSPDELLHGGFEAAWELAGALKHWRKKNQMHPLRRAVTSLERAYRRGDGATKNRILCGVLEHAFEDAALRPFFSDWERDAELREAYKLALEWGAAHEEG